MAEPSTTTPVEAERDRLLATKLHVPRPRPGYLARRRLLERLTEGTAHELTLVCAPAGFGKTSLLGDWVRRSQQRVAWLSLDGGDRDPARFWRYVAAALDTVRPGVRQRADSLFQGAQPSPEAVLTMLVNELVEGPGEVVLVLDDYHLVEAPPVHDSLAALLERVPPQLRLVLASRTDPSLPLARLRAGGQLTELREADLACHAVSRRADGPGQGADAQRNGPLGVTVIDRWIPLVPAPSGTWVARSARTTWHTLTPSALP